MKRLTDLASDARPRPAGDAGPDVPPVEEPVEALRDALEAARLRLEQRLAEDIERHSVELDRLTEQCEQLRAEAATIEETAKETAARIVAEAKQTEARMLGQAQQTVAALLTRLRDRAGPSLERAATEIGAVQEAILAAAAGPGAPAASEGSPARATDPADERVVTRLIVRPAVASDARTRFKEAVESLPGVDAALFGAVDDESFEMLIAHEHSARVPESLLAGAPAGIVLIARAEGRVELELTGDEWLESGEGGS